MLRVDNISFAYKKEPVLKNIDFNLKRGEHLSVIGESGSGKSTLLKLLYGEFDLDQGSIFWGKEKILGPKYNLITGPRFMKYVAQEFDLMPFTSVETNIGEFLSNLDLDKKQKRVKELTQIVGLEDVAKNILKYLSGGQKQRVALARALAIEPEIILLDEPFSHIDNFKKHGLRRDLFGYLKRKKITCITATHDKEDVLGYGDMVLVLDSGKSIAFDKPKTLYKNPKHKLIASFFDEYNEFKTSEISDVKNDKDLLVYAHQIKIVEKSNLNAKVIKSYFKGHFYLIEVNFNGKSIFINHSNDLDKGRTICFKLDTNIFD